MNGKISHHTKISLGVCFGLLLVEIKNCFYACAEEECFECLHVALRVKLEIHLVCGGSARFV